MPLERSTTFYVGAPTTTYPTTTSHSSADIPLTPLLTNGTGRDDCCRCCCLSAAKSDCLALGLGFDSNSATFFAFRKFKCLNYSNFELKSNFHVLRVRCVCLYVPRTPTPYSYELPTCYPVLYATCDSGQELATLEYNVYCPCT